MSGEQWVRDSPNVWIRRAGNGQRAAAYVIRDTAGVGQFCAVMAGRVVATGGLGVVKRAVEQRLGETAR